MSGEYPKYVIPRLTDFDWRRDPRLGYYSWAAGSPNADIPALKAALALFFGGQAELVVREFGDGSHGWSVMRTGKDA